MSNFIIFHISVCTPKSGMNYRMKSLLINSYSTQVIVGTFFIDTKKDTGVGVKGDASASKLPSPVGESVSSLGFRQTVDSSSGNPNRGNDEHQAIGGSHFMVQQLGLHVTPSRPIDWGVHPDSRNSGYEMAGMNSSGFGKPFPFPLLPFYGVRFRLETEVRFPVCRKNRSWSAPIS